MGTTAYYRPKSDRTPRYVYMYVYKYICAAIILGTMKKLDAAMVSPVFWRFSPGLQSSKGVMSKGGKTEMGCDIGMKSTSLNFTQFHFSDFSDFSDFSAAMSKPCPAHQDVMIADIIGGFPGGHLGTSRDRWDQRFGASASRISSRGMTNNQCMVIFFNNQTQHDLFE